MLISVNDVEILPNKKISKQSSYVNKAIQRLRNANKFHTEENEQVFELGDILLMCFDISEEFNKKRGNKNAVR